MWIAQVLIPKVSYLIACCTFHTRTGMLALFMLSQYRPHMPACLLLCVTVWVWGLEGGNNSVSEFE